MSEIPYELLCAKNPFVLLFLRSQIPSSKLTSGGFRNCTRLQKLFFHQSDLADIPPGSFLGLGSLKSLFMVGNRLEELPDFEGLTSSLIYLGLHDNPIRSVDRNAFRGLTNLKGLVLVNANITAIEDGTFDSLGRKTQVFLSGNPFYCDCSLQWLQDWLWKHPSNETFMKYLGVKDDDPRCVAPKPGPLKTLTFCNWSKTSTALASGWFQELLTAFWQTVDFIGITF